MPSKTLRQRVKALLVSFFDEGDDAELDEAMRLVSDFYGVKVPRITWRKRIDRGQTAALTQKDGRFELIRPKYWHLQRARETSPEMWAETLLHEFYHLLTWVDEEQKADDFAERWMEDL